MNGKQVYQIPTHQAPYEMALYIQQKSLGADPGVRALQFGCAALILSETHCRVAYKPIRFEIMNLLWTRERGLLWYELVSSLQHLNFKLNFVN